MSDNEKIIEKLLGHYSAASRWTDSNYRLLQAEREERQEIIEEKQSKTLLKNTLDPLLSQLTKASEANDGAKSYTCTGNGGRKCKLEWYEWVRHWKLLIR